LKSVLIIAGEQSGDMHGAKVVRAVLAKNPDVKFFGIGGERMREAGVEILQDAKDMAVLGLVEVLKRYGFFREVFYRIVDAAKTRKPDAVLLIDYPGFNLRFAEQAHKLGLKVVYYICPQVWAWHRSRVAKMAKIVDRLLVIFPFEVDVFKGTGLRVDFVGHPLVEATRKVLEAPDEPLPWRGSPRVALLPGSRRQELERILPSLIAAASRVEILFPNASFILAAASDEMAELAKMIIEEKGRAVLGAPRAARIEIVTRSTRQILKQADAAWVASGTATLETALMDCPMVVVYRTARMTYEVGKRLIRVPHLGMVNLLAGRELCPELIQDSATPEKLCGAIAPLLTDSPARRAMKEGLAEVRAKLGDGGAAERAAETLLQTLNEPS
jgi:lipid-A-disaccharide synthase